MDFECVLVESARLGLIMVARDVHYLSVQQIFAGPTNSTTQIWNVVPALKLTSESPVHNLTWFINSRFPWVLVPRINSSRCSLSEGYRSCVPARAVVTQFAFPYLSMDR